MRGRHLALDAAAALQTVHHRHHHVADYQVGNIARGHLYALFAVGGGDDVVVGVKQLADKYADVAVVVDDEHDGQVFVYADLALYGVELGLDVHLAYCLVHAHRLLGHVAHRQGDGEHRALADRALHGDGAVVQLDKGLGQRQADARALGVHAVDLVEAVEDVAEVALADAIAGVRHPEGQVFAVAVVADGDRAVVGGVLEGVGEDVEEDALYFLAVDGDGQRLVRKLGLECEPDVALAGQRIERLHPVGHGGTEVDFGELERQLAVLVLAEVKYLIDEALQYLQVLVGDFDEGMLLRREVVGAGNLVDGLGDERQRRAQVVRDVGEEHQL